MKNYTTALEIKQRLISAGKINAIVTDNILESFRTRPLEPLIVKILKISAQGH